MRQTTLDDLQDVGRRSREILIDAANLAYADWMVPKGEAVPGKNDARRRIDHFLAAVASGDTYEAVRRVVRATHDLNNAVTHSGTTTRVNAYAAAQATVFLVRTLQHLQDEWQPF